MPFARRRTSNPRPRSALHRLTAACAPVLAALLVPAPAAATQTWVTAVVPPAAPRPAPTPVPAAPKGKRPVRPTPRPAAVLPFATFTSGDSGAVELATGRYPAGEAPVPPDRLERTFVRIGDARPMPLTGARVDGSRTQLEATYAGVGLATVGVELKLRAVELPAAEFEAILGEAGATAALEERKKRKETKKAARSVVSGSTRAHVGVLPGSRGTQAPDLLKAADDPLGLPLELVLAAPPLGIRAGTPITGRLLRDGKPVPSVPVRVLPATGEPPAAPLTDADGAFQVVPAGEGRLLLAAAVVRRTDKADRKRGEEWKKADWEVVETSLHVNVLPAAPPPPPAAPSPSPTPKKKRK